MLKVAIKTIMKLNQMFHFTRCITPKRVTSLRVHLRVIAPKQSSFFQRNVAAVASRWQLCVRFDRPEIGTSDLLFQRRTRYRSNNWLVKTIMLNQNAHRSVFGKIHRFVQLKINFCLKALLSSLTNLSRQCIFKFKDIINF